MGEEGKETVSHIYNPYDIRQRGIVKAQLEERIASDMQELAALDALETEVSDEQQDVDGEGVKQVTSAGNNGDYCSYDGGSSSLRQAIFQYAQCKSGCCENKRCVAKKRDWFGVDYCPAECRGGPWSGHGKC